MPASGFRFDQEFWDSFAHGPQPEDSSGSQFKSSNPHNFGTDSRIHIFKKPKSIRIKFPKRWTHSHRAMTQDEWDKKQNRSFSAYCGHFLRSRRPVFKSCEPEIAPNIIPRLVLWISFVRTTVLNLINLLFWPIFRLPRADWNVSRMDLYIQVTGSKSEKNDYSHL